MEQTTIGNSRVFGVFFVLLSGCSLSKSIEITSPETISVSSRSIGDAPSDAKKLGETPLELELDPSTGKIFELSAPGKVSQYWVFPGEGEMRARITLSEAPVVDEKKLGRNDALDSLPVYLRQLLKAHSALLNGEYLQAGTLAGELQQMRADLTPGFIIEGLAAYQKGQKERAQTAFLKAKALDPKDPEIDKLLELTQ